jgi:hypothetical protein
MKPRSARLAGLGAVVAAADTVVVAVAVQTAVVVETAVAAAAHADGNCRASSQLSKADNVGETGPLARRPLTTFL